MIMNGMGFVGEFVVYMQVAVLPRYLLVEAEGNDRKPSIYRSVDGKFDLMSSEALMPQYPCKILSQL